MSTDDIPRAVLITGAASGIGRAVTEQLAAQGNTVFAGAIDDAEAKSLTEVGGDVTPVVFDVTDADAVTAALATVNTTLGPTRRLDAVLNIAGMTTNGPLADLTTDTFTRILAVNLVGMHTVTRAALPLLGSGSRVINISSSSGTRTLPFTGAYSASKFGVEALSTAMRMEFAPLGIHVIVVAPANINTPMAGRIKELLSAPPSIPIYIEPLRRFLDQTTKSFANGVPVCEVADVIATAVNTDKPRRRYELHNNYLRDAVLLRRLPVGVREYLISRTLHLHGAPQ
jgi:NAD(P)-dependent dehydrogenase (short-subunit alcohol dehydrogenase family)